MTPSGPGPDPDPAQTRSRPGPTLQQRLQDPVHDPLRQEPPLEDGVIGPPGAEDPLQVTGPADVGHMGRVADVLLKLGPWRRQEVV